MSEREGEWRYQLGENLGARRGHRGYQRTMLEALAVMVRAWKAHFPQ